MGDSNKEEKKNYYPPIDLVYTWVNGADSNWLKDKKSHLQREPGNNTLSKKSYENIRYKNLNELKYSLRSVEKYANFVRKIFIVTADQIPTWLKISHPKVHLISHKDIFPEPQGKYLPTFNSVAIELNLHRIPGLSEHFIYLNDDIFFGRKVHPEHFLTKDGKTKVFMRDKHLEKRKNIKPTNYNYRDSMWYTHQFLNKYVKEEKKRLTLQHVGYLMRKSVMQEIEQLLKEQNHFDKTCTRFRKNCNINLVPFFYPHYCLAKGYAIRCKGVKTMHYSKHHDLYYDHIRHKKPHLYCLNSLPKKTKLLKHFWNEYYPKKSEFEI